MSRRILLIEDNEQNRYLVRFLLEDAGFAVDCANDGRSGVEMAIADTPDLILLDIQLPEMDGYHVARILRGIESLRRVPIVAVTSFAMTGDREKAFAAGCDGYLEKPIDPETFVEDVTAFFDSNPSPSEIP